MRAGGGAKPLPGQGAAIRGAGCRELGSTANVALTASASNSCLKVNAREIASTYCASLLNQTASRDSSSAHAAANLPAADLSPSSIF